MAEENLDAQSAESPPPPSGGLLNGVKGWIIVFSVILLEAAVFLFLMYARESDAPADATDREQVYKEDPAILQSKVTFENFSATIPGPGGDLRPLNFTMVLELHHLPQEKRPGAVRPTSAQIEVFRTVVVQLEAKVRDHMNTFLTGQSFTNLVGDRGPELVKAEVMRFVNNELEKYDFEALKIPPDISRRRVTNVLLPSWTLM